MTNEQKAQHKKNNRTVFSAFGLLFAIALIFYFFTAGTAENPRKNKGSTADNITPNPVQLIALDEPFLSDISNIAMELFQQLYEEDDNILISPPSIYFALSMAANSTSGTTLEAFDELLSRDASAANRNAYNHALIKELTEVDEKILEDYFFLFRDTDYKVSIQNSIWYDDELDLAPDFLQQSTDYYGARAYREDFEDEKTVERINDWVRESTDGHIDSILNEIPPDTLLYLINTVLFDQAWHMPYDERQVREGTFHTPHGTVDVDFMYDTENYYIEGQGFTGFAKPYIGKTYSFVALLPDEGHSLGSLVPSLTGETLRNLYLGASREEVLSSMPKFSFDYEAELSRVLDAMSDDRIFDFRFAEVLHKAYIDVNEQGTTAGAATSWTTSGIPDPEPKEVHLDRPFLFAIVENNTGVPLFIGTLTDPT